MSDHANLVAGGLDRVPFVHPGEPAKSQVLHLIEDGSMPPGGRKRPTREEVAVLKAWVADTATPFPASFDDAATFRLMVDDIAKQPEKDVPHLRYFSFAPLLRESATLSDLTKREAELFDALKRCGFKTMPEPVDPTATLYRFDLREAGWSSRELFVRTGKGAEGTHPLSPYDLLLLEYPHGSRHSTIDPSARPLEAYLQAVKLIRPVPFVRAEWLATVLKPDAPLVAELTSLTELHRELAKDNFPAVGNEKLVCGPRPRAFGGLNPVPAALKPEGERAILPVGAWYAGDTQAEPPPFKLTVEAVNADGKALKTIAKGEPFRLRVNTDKSVNFVLMMVWADGHVRVQPTRQGGFLKGGEEHLLTPDGAEAFKIATVLTGGATATEYFVLLASVDQLPAPTIVRSRHALSCDNPKRSPVYRFFSDADAKFDDTRVIRRVVPVTVTAAKPG